MNLTDRSYARLKRLQVWTGVVPVGLFLVSHLLTNARALGGERAFDAAAAAIARLPLLAWVEVLAIGLPLLAHIGLGALLATTAQGAEDDGGYPAPAWLWLQRVTGLYLVVYIVFHVWWTRFAPARGPEAAGLFDLTARALAHPGVFAFHLGGVLAAAAHFGNGFVALAGRHGLAAPPALRRRLVRAGVAAAAVLALLGTLALAAFVDPRLRWFEPRAAAPAAAPAAAGR